MQDLWDRLLVQTQIYSLRNSFFCAEKKTAEYQFSQSNTEQKYKHKVPASPTL